MNVKLFSHTMEESGLNLLEQIAYVARVSNPSNQHNHETAEKLVNYLIKHKHWSPLEMVSAIALVRSVSAVQMRRWREP